MISSFISAAVIASAASAADSCRTLVLSGGGNNGAWEVGVLYGLINNGTESDYAYDVITGVSAGSINTIGMAGWKIGNEKAMVDWLSDLWKNLKTDDVWVDWPLGKISGMTIKAGAVDNRPLLAYLKNMIAQFSDFQRRVTLSSVEVNTGVYTEFDQNNIQFSELADASVSSASIPFVFPPHIWEGKGVFMDGGTVYNINMEGAIRQCMDGIVDDESKIIMDVFLCGAPDTPTEEEKVGNSWSNYFRGRGLDKYYGDTDSLAQSLDAHPNIKLRHVVKQTVGGFSGLSELNFDGDYTWPAQVQGRQDGIDTLNATGNGVAPFFYEWINNDEECQAEYSNVGDYINVRQAEERFTSLFEEMLLN